MLVSSQPSVLWREHHERDESPTDLYDLRSAEGRAVDPEGPQAMHSFLVVRL